MDFKIISLEIYYRQALQLNLGYCWARVRFSALNRGKRYPVLGEVGNYGAYFNRLQVSNYDFLKKLELIKEK